MTKADMEVGLAMAISLEVLICGKITLLLKCVLGIYHMVQFKKDQVKMQALVNSSNEVNAMTPTYTTRLDLKIWSTDINAQKIDGSTFEMFGMILTSFQVKDKFEKTWFFLKNLLISQY